MKERVISLQKEIKEFKKGSTVDEDRFHDEDDKVCYILQWAWGTVLVLAAGSLYMFIHIYSTHSETEIKLDPIQQLFVTLMRLRLWYPDKTFLTAFKFINLP